MQSNECSHVESLKQTLQPPSPTIIESYPDDTPFPSYLTLERDNCIIILKDIPADICENCEEYYLNQSTTAAVLSPAERQSEVEILRFAA
jgi:hypothetical protein